MARPRCILFCRCDRLHRLDGRTVFWLERKEIREPDDRLVERGRTLAGRLGWWGCLHEILWRMLLLLQLLLELLSVDRGRRLLRRFFTPKGRHFTD